MQSVGKLYKDARIHALDNINFEVNQGEYVSIVGESGSGKTTLMHILGCLDMPSSGQYLLAGVDISCMPDNTLAKIRGTQIGFVFQSFRLSEDLNALENVELPLMFQGVPRKEREQRAMAALAQVGLIDRLYHRPGALSGGQQQRVAIARAMAAEPAILLADEPTGNLDPRATAEIMHLFDELHQAGNTIILITHDEEVSRRAERCMRMHDGRLYQT